MPRAPKKKPASRKVTGNPDAITLPSAEHGTGRELTDHHIILYGEKGIGKTTLAAEFPGNVLFLTERGRKNLTIPRIPKPKEKPLDWPRFRKYINEIIDNQPDITRVTIDTLDRLGELADFWYAQTHLNKKTIYGHNDYGTSWNGLKHELEAPFLDLDDAGIAVTFISHHRRRPRVSRGVSREEAADQPEQTQPTAAGWLQDFVRSFCDFAFQYDWLDHDRMIVVKGGGEIWTANGMLGRRFAQPKGSPRAGEPYNAFLLPDSPRESYERLSEAYHNRVEGIFFDELDNEE